MYNQLSVSTPGRICLFGEHQDYLGLPVIAAAISRRVTIAGSPIQDQEIRIQLPDIQSSEQFRLAVPFQYTKARDYYRSVLNVLHKEGLTFKGGFSCEVHGNIPINSGTSSSSALIASWIGFLAHFSEQRPNWSSKKIAELAHKAEIEEFGEPGGMMDHYSTVIGDVIYLESEPNIYVEKLSPTLGTFVLGDSLEPKDTIQILARVKYGMLAIIDKIKQVDNTFSLHNTSTATIQDYRSILTSDEFLLLEGNFSDRDILREAKTLLSNSTTDHQQFGNLLNAHFENLRDAKQISTPKLNRMVDASLAAGALGAKTNGSGGGGCMFAYAPEQPEKVVEAIEKVGGKAYIISIASGIETQENNA
ncbi:MAG: galactokinase family protein [Spirosomataceae bacterium]